MGNGMHELERGSYSAVVPLALRFLRRHNAGSARTTNVKPHSFQYVPFLFLASLFKTPRLDCLSYGVNDSRTGDHGAVGRRKCVLESFLRKTSLWTCESGVHEEDSSLPG